LIVLELYIRLWRYGSSQLLLVVLEMDHVAGGEITILQSKWIMEPELLTYRLQLMHMSSSWCHKLAAQTSCRTPSKVQ
jgi:hypothetical protein